jgi:hypothetical protein
MGEAALGKMLDGGAVANAAPPNPSNSKKQESDTFMQMEIEANKKAAQQALKKEAEANVQALGPQKVLDEVTKEEANIQTPTDTGKVGFGSPIAKPMDKIGAVLADLLTLGGHLQSPTIAAIREQGKYDMATKAMEIGATSSEEQQEQRDEFFKGILQPEPMSAESEKSFGFAERTNNAIKGVYELIGMKDNDGNIIKLDINKLKTAAPGSELRQKLTFLRDEIVNSILRKESGAAISEKEVARASKHVGINLNIKALMTNPDALKFALDTLSASSSKTVSRLQPNSQTSNLVKQLLSQGYDKDKIYSALQERGMI